MFLALTTASCGGTEKVVPAKPVAAPQKTPWKPDGMPALLSDLERFVRRPDLRPDMLAMGLFRLAALKEDGAREEADASGTPIQLQPSIDIYRRILREFPQFEHRASVQYVLGHALYDVQRIPESQQVFRALVCHNHHPYPVSNDPADPSRDEVQPLPQDHDQAFWQAWETRHPLPIDMTPPGVRPANDEIVFADPFPSDCAAMSSQQAQRYMGEVWLRMGDAYFDQTDATPGPYGLNRAASAYRHGIPISQAPVHGVLLYKLAWTYFKQQRYEAAVRGFVDLLRYIETEKARTGDPGADFRAEAVTYIAGAITYVDFAGPREEDPFIPRNDVLDTERDPHVAEQKMHVGIDRVVQSTLIPQAEPWTPDVYEALANEYRELNQMLNCIDISERYLAKWPLHPNAPAVHGGIVEAHLRLAAQFATGSPNRDARVRDAKLTLDKLAMYVGDSAWMKANKQNAKAIERAAQIVAKLRKDIGAP